MCSEKPHKLLKIEKKESKDDNPVSKQNSGNQELINRILEDSTNKINELKDQIFKKDNEISSLRIDLHNALNKKAMEKNESVRKAYDEVTKERDNLRITINKNKEDLANTEKKYKKMIEEKEDLIKKLIENNELMEKKNVKELKEKNSKLEKEIKEINTANIEAQKLLILNDNQIKDLQGIVRAGVEKLKLKEDELKETKKNNEKILKDLKQNENELATAAQKLKKTEESLNISIINCESANNSNDTLRKTIEDFHREFKRQEDEIKRHKEIYLEEKTKLEKSLTEREKSLRELVVTHDSTKKTLDEFKANITILAKNNATITAEKLQLVAEKAQLQTEKGQLEADKGQLQMEKLHLEDDKRQLQIQKGQLEAEKRQLQKEIGQLEADKKHLQKEIIQLEAEKKQLQAKIEQLDKEVKDCEKMIAELNNDIFSKITTISNLTNDNTNLSSKIEVLTIEKVELTVIISTTKDEQRAVEERLIKHKNYIEFIKNQHRDYKNYHEQEHHKHSHQIEEMEKHYQNAYKQETTRLSQEINKLNIKLEHLNNELNAEIERYKKLERAYLDKDKELHVLDEQHTQVLAKIKTLEAIILKNESTISDFESKVSAKNEKLNEKRKEIKELDDKVESLKKINNSLKSDIDDLNNQVTKLEKSLKKESTKLADTVLELNHYKNKLNLIDNPEQQAKISSKKSVNAYDFVIDIDSLKATAQSGGWEITDNSSKSKQNKDYSIVGIVGRENIGKTYILNKICGFDLPSGTNLNTKGLSLKYSQNGSLLCLDSAGIQTPVYYFDKKLMKRFKTTKEDLKKNDEKRREMINDRTITDIFIQDFILNVADVIIIVVGQMSQNDQKFIERIANKYKAMKRIIIIHNFSNLYAIKDVERKIQKDITETFDTISREISNSDIQEFIEKSQKKNKENISHLVLGVDWTESGEKYNKPTFKYLQDILDTQITKRKFDLLGNLEEFLQENYRLYLKFLEKPQEPLGLVQEDNKIYIDTKEEYEVSNPIFNALGNLVSNPPFDVYEKSDKYIILLEISDLAKEPNIKFEIKPLNEFKNLIVTGLKAISPFSDDKDYINSVSFRNWGEFKCIIPLCPLEIKVRVPKAESYKYKSGVLKVEVEKVGDEVEDC